jgi:hypothetical protein
VSSQRALRGQVTVLARRMDALKAAIQERDWENVEWHYDNVLGAVARLERTTGPELPARQGGDPPGATRGRQADASTCMSSDITELARIRRMATLKRAVITKLPDGRYKVTDRLTEKQIAVCPDLLSLEAKITGLEGV